MPELCPPHILNIPGCTPLQMKIRSLKVVSEEAEELSFPGEGEVGPARLKSLQLLHSPGRFPGNRARMWSASQVLVPQWNA